MEKQFFRVTEVAEILGLGKSMVYKLVMEGRIPSIHIADSRSRRVPRAALEKWITEEAKKAQDGSPSY